MRTRTLFLTASIGAIALVACGDAPDSMSGAPRKITLGASGTPSVAAGGAALDEKMSMLPWFDVEYSFTGELPDLGTEAGSWRFAPGLEPSEERVVSLARALGVEGDVRRLSADMGGGWMVGPDDYSAPTLTVAADAMLSWWYNGMIDSSATVSCVEPSSDPTTSEPIKSLCVEPAPPSGVPSADEARGLAESLFDDLGIDVGDYRLDVYADDWSASVTGFRSLGGVEVPITVSAGYGADAALTWASGMLAEPEQDANYPIVSTADGLARLNSGDFGWGMYGGGVARGGVATDMAMPADAGVPAEGETLEVILVSVELGLTQVWDTDGTVWLLPAYVFTDADGGNYSVLAVTDEYIVVPEVPTVPVDTVPVDTVTVPDIVDPMVDPADAAALVGLAESDAVERAAGIGWELRIVRLDGVDLAVTDDLRTNRVNVAVDGGVVTEIVSVG
ncbi:MAG: hypothetical protein ACKOA2_02890 [Ilumatobacteraceae bacterium]